MVQQVPTSIPAPRPFSGQGRLIDHVAEIPPETAETAKAAAGLFANLGSLFARLAGRKQASADDAVTAQRAARDRADRYAVNTAQWQAETALNNSLMAAWKQYHNDPVAFDQALGKAKSDWVNAVVAGSATDQAAQQASYGKIFDLRAAPFRDAVTGLVLLNRGQGAARAADGLVTSYNIVGQSARLAANAPNGDKIIAAEVARTSAQIDGMVGAGVLSPAAAAAQKKRVAGAAIGGRALAEFDLIDDPDDKAAFADNVAQSYASGRGPLAALDKSAAAGVIGQLQAEAAAAQQQQAAARAADASFAANGNPALAGEGFQRVAAGQLTSDWLETNRPDMPPLALASFTRALDPNAPPLARDPATLVALAKAASDGAPVADAALDAHASGRIGTDDLQRIGLLASNPRRDVVQRFDMALAPPADASAAEQSAHWQDTLALNGWLSAHGEADDKTIDRHLTAFIDDRGKARKQLIRASLPLPALVPASDKAAVSAAGIASARQRLVAMAKGSAIDTADAGRQARLLDQWSRAVEA
jgi:hypothetical protein